MKIRKGQDEWFRFFHKPMLKLSNFARERPLKLGFLSTDTLFIGGGIHRNVCHKGMINL